MMGCSAQWISVALADLPVLAQMALNLGMLAATMEGKTMSAAETASIQSIAAEAGKDLSLLQALYNDYKQNPSASGMQKIEDAIETLQQNLTGMLAAAHISDPATAQRVTAGVNLILTTVESFAALMPKAATAASARLASKAGANPSTSSGQALGHPIITAKELKAKWNEGVCAGATAGCEVK
jgi:hypothetical protein